MSRRRTVFQRCRARLPRLIGGVVARKDTNGSEWRATTDEDDNYEYAVAL